MSVHPADLPAIAPEQPDDHAAVDALVDRAFGPGRFTKVSERLREGNVMLADLSMVARAGGQVIGCARMWPITVGGQRCAFLGPLAVEADQRKGGLGAALVDAASLAARDAGWPAVVLVGDLAFFERVGFERLPSGSVTLPGPVDPLRVLVRRFEDVALEGAMKVAPELVA